MILPDPLTPPDLDLRDLPCMMLDVQRVLFSEFVNSSSDAGFRAAVNLWCVSWHQIPAASLPDNDAILARFAGLGGNLRKWQKVRDEALHGFMKCSDGRLYHRIISEKAIEADEIREKYSARTRKGNATKIAKKLNEINETAVAKQTLSNPSADAEQALTAAQRCNRIEENRKEEEVGFKNQESTTTASFVTRDLAHAGLQKQEKQAEVESGEDGPWRDLAVRIVQLFEAAKNPTFPDPHSAIPKWKEAEFDPKTIERVIADGLTRKPDVRGLSYFASQLSQEHEKQKLLSASVAPVVRDRAYWLSHLDIWEKNQGFWAGKGNDPRSPSCLVPMDMLIEFGYRDANGKEWPHPDRHGHEGPAPDMELRKRRYAKWLADNEAEAKKANGKVH